MIIRGALFPGTAQHGQVPLEDIREIDARELFFRVVGDDGDDGVSVDTCVYIHSDDSNVPQSAP